MRLKFFCIAFLLVSWSIAGGARAQYMSMFNAANMSAVNIAGTVAVNSAIGKSAKIARRKTAGAGDAGLAPARPNEAYRPIRYSVDPRVRAAVIKTYVDRAKTLDAGEGAALEALFRERDLIQETAGNFGAYGLDINDLGDVIAAYWAVNWGAVHQSGRPSRAQVKGLQGQIRKTLAGSNLADRTSKAGLQQIADDMLIRLILIDGAVEQGLREGNRAQVQHVGTYVRQSSFAQMGIDLGQLNLTSRGLVPR